MVTTKPNNIDEYISGFPPDVQQMLQQVRVTIKEAAPGAEETIKYAMPTFTYKGNLVYFAAFKKHIGFYPVPTGNDAFEKELSSYKTGKGSVQFLFDRPMPLTLIRRLVKFWVQRNTEKEEHPKHDGTNTINRFQ